ncbi:MAG: phosphatase [Saprospiraceae bacterium]|nr:phosphatase [Saprospiraceae bacterium]
MLLGAIDIGSNAIRLQIVRVMGTEELSFKKAEYLRFPLRLGRDVFSKGKISPATEQKFFNLMHAFKILLDLYEVNDTMAVATSAMREAENGADIVARVKSKLNLDIEIITGDLEAELISKAIIPTIDQRQYVHIDVGGGSTELNIYSLRKKIASKSFRIGTVRKLDRIAKKETFMSMKDWFDQSSFFRERQVYAIGTGGNINKLRDLSNTKGKKILSLTELKALKAYIKTFSINQRISDLKMNPDRADVIVPASEIYSKVMNIIRADQIFVPGVGLKDGIIYTLYSRVNNQENEDMQFIEQEYIGR